MLEYLRKHVTEWPEDATNVRLDFDSEICFHTISGHTDHDFFPLEGLRSGNGIKYTREEWEQTETDLTKLDKPFGELDRATQLKLVEHVLDGGGVEYNCFGEWLSRDSLTRCNGIMFNLSTVYRAKYNDNETI